MALCENIAMRERSRQWISTKSFFTEISSSNVSRLSTVISNRFIGSRVNPGWKEPKEIIQPSLLPKQRQLWTRGFKKNKNNTTTSQFFLFISWTPLTTRKQPRSHQAFENNYILFFFSFFKYKGVYLKMTEHEAFPSSSTQWRKQGKKNLSW